MTEQKTECVKKEFKDHFVSACLSNVINLEKWSRLQSFQSCSKNQNILPHLGVDLGLRGSRVLLDELCDAQDTSSLRANTKTGIKPKTRLSRR